MITRRSTHRQRLPLFSDLRSGYRSTNEPNILLLHVNFTKANVIDFFLLRSTSKGPSSVPQVFTTRVIAELLDDLDVYSDINTLLMSESTWLIKSDRRR